MVVGTYVYIVDLSEQRLFRWISIVCYLSLGDCVRAAHSTPALRRREAIWGNWAVHKLRNFKNNKKKIMIKNLFFLCHLFWHVAAQNAHLYHLRHLDSNFSPIVSDATLNIPFDWKFHSHARSDSFASSCATLLYIYVYRARAQHTHTHTARWLISPVIFPLCHFQIALANCYFAREL